MKRSRRRSNGSFGQQSDVSFSDTEEYRPRNVSGLGGDRGSAEDRKKVELRRLKNREAARRVRERKTNQLSAYKSQVDELKRENQKLLQIIAQLQGASLGCTSAPLATTTSTQAEGEAEVPTNTATTSGLSAGVPPDSIDSGPCGVRSTDAAAAAAAAGASQQQQQQPPLQTQQQLQPQQQKLLGSSTSWHPGTGGAGHDTNASGSCVLSQPANTSAVFSSSTMQLLSGCHSAPVPASNQQHKQQQVLLQRTCGCVEDEECEECEGVRVTLSSCSNLPLVTTPGPRPKLLTLEDLNLHGLSYAASAHLHTGSLMSAPLLPCKVSGSSLVANTRDNPAAAAVGRSLDGAELRLLHQQRHGHKQGQATVKEQEALAGMDVDELVGTLEPSSRAHALRLDSHSSSGHAVFGAPAVPAAAAELGGSCTESCYVRKSSSTRSTRQRSSPPQQQQEPTAPQAQELAGVVGGVAGNPQGATATAAAAAAAGDAGVQPEAAVFIPFPAATVPFPAATEATAAVTAAGAGADTASGMMNGGLELQTAFTLNLDVAAADDAARALAPAAAAVGPASPTGFQQQPSSGGGKQSSKPGHRLMRTIAAAVNGLVRSGRRNSGSSAGTPRSATAAAALVAQEQQDFVGRSLSAHTLARGNTSNFSFSSPTAAAAAAAAAGAGSASFSAAAGHSMQQGSVPGRTLLPGFSSAMQPSSQDMLLAQLSGSQSGGSMRGFSSSQLPALQQQQQQASGDDAIIMEAQVMLLQQHQQQREMSAAAAGSAGNISRGTSITAAAGFSAMPVTQQGAAAGGDGGSSRRPSAMDTTHVWPSAGLQQQQQQDVFGLPPLSQLLPAAAVLPADFQATYTDGGLAGEGAAADDDVVMLLARQEGVLIDKDDTMLHSSS